MRRHSIFDTALLLIFLVLFFALGAVTKDIVEPDIVAVGDKAPKFSLQTDDGRVLTREHFGGRLLVVNFWATWCPPCIVETPSLDEFTRILQKEGVVVVAVSIDEDEGSYRDFLGRVSPTFLTTRDGASDLASAFGTYKVPETFVIDRTGHIVRKYVDARDWTEPALLADIRGLLRR